MTVVRQYLRSVLCLTFLVLFAGQSPAYADVLCKVRKTGQLIVRHANCKRRVEIRVNGSQLDLGQNSGTSTLHFQGVAPDITTATAEDLTIIPGQDGNVGIGSTTPDAFLDVESNSSNATADLLVGQQLTLVDSGAVASGSDLTLGLDLNVARLGATGGTISTTGLNLSVTGDSGGDSTTTGLAVNVSGADTNYAATFLGGNVGIGVSDPDEALEIDGRIHILDSTAPADTANKLYATGGTLFWNGVDVSSSSAGGDISSVTAGTGMTGGGLIGDVTLNVDVGTTANKIVQLTGAAALPAVSGANVTGLNASALATGTVPDARLSPNVSTLGSSIDLATEVTGTLPIGNGGTGATSFTDLFTLGTHTTGDYVANVASGTGLAGGSAGAEAASLTLSIDQAFTPTWTGAHIFSSTLTANGNVTLGNATTDTLTIGSTVQGASPLRFDGATADANATSFAFTDPTAARTITFPDASGTVALAGSGSAGYLLDSGDTGAGAYTFTGTMDLTGTVVQGASPFVGEGATDDANEATFALTDPTADRTFTFPDASGEVSLLGQTVDLTAEVTGTLPVGNGGTGATSLNDLITLATHTTGNYVGNVANGTGISGGSAGSENASLTLSIDQAFTPTWTGAHIFSNTATFNGNVALGDTTGDTLSLGGTIQGATPFTLEGATADANELTIALADPSADRTITFPDATGTVALTGSSTAGYLLDTGDTGAGAYAFTGTMDLTGTVVEGASPFVLEGATADANEATFALTDPTADRTFTFPDASGEVSLLGQTVDLTGEVTGTLPVGNGGTGATSLNDLITLATHTTGNYVASVANGTGISGGAAGSESAALTLSIDQAFTPTWTGAHVFSSTVTVNNTSALNGNVTLGDAAADTLTIGATVQGASPFTLEGSTADGNELTLAVADPTADNTITFPNASGTVALAGSGSAGYLLDTGDTGAGAYTFTGTMDLTGTVVQGASPLVLEGATDDGSETTLALADPTADRTITFPDASGEVSLLGQTVDLTAEVTGTLPVGNGGTGATSLNDLITLATHTTGNYVGNVANGTGITGGSAGSENASLTLAVDQAFTPTWTGAHVFSNTATFNGNTVVGDAATDTLSIASTVQGASPLTFEGSTADTSETTFAITDPTADRTITFPDATGTVALAGSGSAGYLLDTGDTGAGAYVFTGTMDLTGTVVEGASPFVLEGATADANEATFALTDPTADRTFTFPDASGEVSLLGQTVDLTGEVTGTLPVGNGGTGATSLNDLITLATHTTGNYVASVANGTGISGGAAGSESAALTLSIDQAFTPTWTGAHVFSNTVTVNNTSALNGNVTLGDAAADTLTIGATVQGASPFTLEGSTADGNELTLAVADPTADNTITFPNASGTVALAGSASAGYLLDTGDTGAGAYVFTGTMDLTGTVVQGASPLVLEGATDDGSETTFAVADPTADRTVTFPDASGEVSLLGQTVDLTAEVTGTLPVGNGGTGATSLNDLITLATHTTGNYVGNVANGTGITGGSAGSENASLTLAVDQAFTPTWTGAHVFESNVTLGNAATDTLSIASTVQGASPLTFEGSTADTSETTFAIADPTADRTITFPDATGTVALAGSGSAGYLLDTGDTGAGAYVFTGTMDLTGTVVEGASPFVLEGATADANEATFALTDPTADRTVTFPDASGEVSLLGQTVDLTAEVTGTLPVGNGGTGATSLNDLITLATHTTGNYVASVANGTGISGGAAGSESAALTLSIDQAFTPTWTGAHVFSNTATLNGNTVVGDAATDTLSIASTVQGASPLTFEGSTADTSETTFAIADPTADRTITFPDATGTVALAGSGSAGYLLDTGDTGAGAYVFTGTMDLTGTVVEGASPLVLEGASADGSETTIALTDPTADRTVTFPDASGEVSLLGQTVDLTAEVTGTLPVGNGGTGATSLNDLITLATHTTGNYVGNVANGTGITGGSAGSENASLTLAVDQAFTPTWTGAHVFSNTVTVNNTSALNGNVTLGDAAADTLTIGATVQGASPLTFEGSTADGNELTLAVADPTADNTITFPNASGTVALAGSASAGYLLDTGDTGAGAYVFTGTMDLTGTVVQGASPLVGEGATDDANEATFALTDPTADRTFTFPDASGEVSLLGQTVDLTAEVTGTLPVGNGGTGATSLNDLITLATHTTGNYVGNVANGTGITGGSAGSENASLTLAIDQAFTPTWTGAHVFESNVTLGNAATDTLSITSTVQGASPLTFEGSTADTNETTFAIADPTADRTITFPDATGTVALAGSGSSGYLLDTGDTGAGAYIFTGTMDLTGTVVEGASPFVLEGASADANEATFALTDPTADRTFTFPDASGEVSLLGQTVDLTAEVTGTLPVGNGGTGATSLNDLITLATHTTGNYVGNVANGTGITGGSAGSENASLTLAVDQAFTPTWTGAHVFSNTVTVNNTSALNGNVTLGDAAADTLTIGATVQGASPLTFEGSTADGNELTLAVADPTADNTITFPNASGTVALAGSSSSGYLLDNGDTGAGAYIFTGTMDLTGTVVQGASPLVLEGATDDGSETTFAVADPTADRTVTFPDASGEVSLLGQTVDLTAEVTGTLPVGNGGTGATSLNDLITLATHTTGNYVGNVANGTGITGGSAGSENASLTLAVDQAFTPTWTGAHVFESNVTLGNAATDTLSIASTVQGASPLTFEGSTADTSETTFAIADPTADRTITFPDATGTVALAGSGSAGYLLDTGDTGAGAYVFTGTMDLTGTVVEGASPFVLEGATADANEATFALTDPTADRTFTFPDATGEVSLLGQTVDLTAEVTGTLPVGNGGTGATSLNDLITLATHTTGNYVASVANGTGISGGAAGSESAALTLSIDQAFTPTWTGAHVFSNTATLNGNTVVGDAATDTLSIASTVQGASPLTFEGSTADTSETTFAIADPTADRTITFPDATGTVALAGSGSAGYLLDTGDTGAGAYVFTGTMDLTGTVVEGASPLVLEGASADGSETTIALTDPTADRTVTFPDASGEVSLLGQTVDLTAEVTGTLPVGNGGTGATSLNDLITLATHTTGNYVGNVANGTGITGGSAGSENASLTLAIDQAFTPTWTGAHVFESNVTLGNAATDTLSITSTVQGASPLTFEGSTADTSETTFAIADPTADRTITFPDATGTVALAGSGSAGYLLDTGDTGAGAYVFTGTMDLTGTVVDGASPFVLEGATADANEATFALTDPTADRTFTFPDASGEVSLLGQTVDLTAEVTGTLPVGNGGTGATSLNDLITLATHTTGNYVASVANGTGISGGAAGSESAALTLSIDQAFTPTWTGAHVFSNTVTVNNTSALNGNVTLGDAAADTLTIGATVQGASPFTLEGSTADGNELTLAVADPTADNTITFPNASGTVALAGSSSSGYLLDNGDTGAGAYIFTGTMDLTGTVVEGASPLVFEGASADGSETTIALTDPTADRTVTFPDASGEVSLLGQTVDLTAEVTGTLPVGNGGTGATSLNDLITLATHTTGNYVGNVANGTGITGGSAGSENASLTLAVDQAFTPTWTGAHVFESNVTLGNAATDTLSIASTVQGASPMTFEGSTADTNETTFAIADPTADRTITFPDATGTVALAGSGSAGYLLDTGDTGAGAYVFTGTMDLTGTVVQGASPLVGEGATDDANEATFALTDPTADRTFTFPDATGEVSLLGQTVDLTAEVTGTLPVGNGGTGATSLNDLITLATHTTGNYVGNVANGTGITGGSAGSENASLTLAVDQAFTPTWTGAHVFESNVTLGNAATDTLSIASTVQGASPLTFEGSTADTSETTFAIADPTADRTITFPDATGTVALAGSGSAGYLLDTGDTGAGAYVFTGTMDLTGTVVEGASPFVLEGATADANEATFALTDPTADRTFTFPDASGEVSLLGQTVDLTAEVTGTLPVGNGGTGATSLNDLITLATHTTGNYVASVANGTGISGGAAGSESAALTLSIDQAFTPTWTGAHVFSNTATFNGNTVVGDAATDTLSIASTVQGASPLTFEGSTADGNELTFAVADPTADNTITFPNASGTVALAGSSSSGYLLDNGDTGAGAYVFTGTMDLTGTVVEGASPLVLEGASADGSETTIALTDPTADRTVTFPDASGEVSLLGQTVDLTAEVTGTLPVGNGGTGATSLNDLITLATHTTGNYVGNVANGTGITGGSAGSENASLTLAVDQAFTPTWTGAHVFESNVTLGNAATDTLSVASTVQGASPLTFEGSTADTNETTFAIADPTADRTITFPDATGTVALSGSGSAGYLLDTGDTGAGAYVFTGTMDLTGTVVQGASPLVVEGATDDGSETTFAVADPTADRTVTFPDASGEVSLLGQTVDLTAEVTGTLPVGNGGTGATSLNDLITLATHTTGNYVGNVANGTGITGGSAGSENASLTLAVDQAFTPTWTGAHVFESNVTLGNAATDTLAIASTVQGASPLTFEGSTADTNETTFAIADPTADNTITFPNASGTVALAGSSSSGYLLDNGDTGAGAYIFTGTMDLTGTVVEGASPLVLEGASADGSETTIALTDPTADRTVTFPDASGEVSLLGQTVDLTAEVTGTLPVGNGGTGATSLNDLITLATHTTGNYVGNVANGTGITGGSAGSENASLTLAVDQAFTPTWTGAHVFESNVTLGNAATDTLSIASTVQGASPLTFEGSTADTNETTFAIADPTADRTITFPDATGTVALAGSGSAGYLLDTGDTGAGAYVFTGTMDLTGTVVEGASPLVLEGASADGSETTIALTDPTADRTVTFPDASGEVSLLGQTVDLTAEVTGTLPVGNGGTGATSLNDLITLATHTTGNYVGNVANGTGITGGSAGSENASLTLAVDQAFTPTWTGAHVFESNVTLGNAATDTLSVASTVQGASPLTFEGSTADTNETAFAIADPTADRTITFPDATGTVALAGSSSSGYLLDNGDTGAGTYVFTGTMDLTGTVVQGASPLVLEGATDDGSETTIAVADPTADRTVTFPNASGEVSLLGQNVDLTAEVTGTLPVGNGGTGATSLNDLITLATHTTGNYVASVANGTGISGGAAGSESAALTLSIDQAFTPTWTGAHVFESNVTLGNAATDTLSITSTVQGASPLTFEGSTADTNETTFAVADPTADRTITFPDATGTVALAGSSSSGYLLDNGDTGAGAYVFTGTLDLTGTVVDGASPFVLEGATPDANETTFALIDPTADRTVTFPDASGTVALTGGAGIQHERLTTGSCATTGCSVAITWDVAFADTNYTATCSVSESTGGAEDGLSVSHIESVAVGSIQVAVRNDNGSAITGTLHCIAMHD